MKISELGKTVTGKTPSTKNEKYFDGNILFITPTDITNGGYVEQTERHISEEGFNSIKTNTISGKSILVGCIGSDMGNVSWTDKTCASNQQINAITDIIDEINPIYIYYKLSQMKEYLRQLAGTTTTPILPKSIFDDIDLEIQDRNIQDKIVGILFNIDKKIENNNKINAELESLAKTIYDYWFLQFEFPNEEGKPYKSSGGKMVWNEELKREIPEGWEVFTYNNLFKFDKGKIPDELSDVRDGKLNNPYITIDVANGSLAQYCSSEKMIYCNGETIMVMDGAASGDVYIGNIGVLGSTFAMLSPVNVQISNSFIYWILKSNSEIYKKANTGSTVPHANRKYIESMKIALPKDIKKLTKIFDDLQQKINHNRKENRELASLRDFLLPMLMNGQVGFKE